MRALAAAVLLGCAAAVAGCSGGGDGPPSATTTAPSVLATAAEDWGWPVAGAIVAPFGPAHPRGIDIAAPVGTEVHATRSGQVVFAGGDDCCDTGLHVIVDHGGGSFSVYGRLAAMTVRSGERVERGDVLGTTGDSGTEGAAATHLHFEIRRGDVYQNPGAFLRGAPASP